MIKARKGAVRCLLVRAPFLEGTFYNPRDMFRLLGGESAAPPLGLLITAAYLPKAWELKFIDGDHDPITDEALEWADVLMISGKGPQIIPISKLIERANAHGVTNVVGGAGPTLQPDDFIAIADYVVCGESELVLPQLLADIEAGVSAGIYKATETPDPSLDTPLPRYDLVELDRYMFVGMSYTRGCPFSCEFCAQIEIFGRKPRSQTVDQVLAEHQLLFDLGHRGMIDLGYDNLIGDIKKTEQVLSALRDWNRAHGHPFFYSTEATMNLARQPRLLELMRDNDFRYVFMGIESGDPDALNQTKKGQNTAMPPEEAIRIVNSYGMIVNTGLILGFDAESKDAADKMLAMVQRTGVFPTLVLPLHALPNTELARRLAREGRLFERFSMESDVRTDTATTGLNFRTSRPRVEVMKDLIRVLDELYQPANHWERTQLIIKQLKTDYKFRPSLPKLAKLAGSFLKIIKMFNADPEAMPYFWRSLAMTVIKNPGALQAVIGQAVMNVNYAQQSRSYIEALREEIAEVEKVGEEAFNQHMVGDVERPRHLAVAQ